MSGPRSINFVSFLLTVAFVLGGYAAVRFVPAYWTQYQMKQALREACAKIYQMRRFGGNSFEKMEAIEASLHTEMRELGIDDPAATIEFPTDDPAWIVARATYDIVIRHPLVEEPTILHFAPEARLDSAAVDWDKKR